MIFHKSMMIRGIMGLNLGLSDGDHIYGQNPLLGPNQFNSSLEQMHPFLKVERVINLSDRKTIKLSSVVETI